jgi:hypothetical protein
MDWTGYTLDRVIGIYYQDNKSILKKNSPYDHFSALKLIKLDEVINKIKPLL